jgi:hypothetical protein
MAQRSERSRLVAPSKSRFRRLIFALLGNAALPFAKRELSQNPILSIHRFKTGTGKPMPYPAATVFSSCPSSAQWLPARARRHGDGAPCADRRCRSRSKTD